MNIPTQEQLSIEAVFLNMLIGWLIGTTIGVILIVVFHPELTQFYHWVLSLIS